MKVNEQTIQQIERFLNKIANKFPVGEEASIMTDIHIRANQDNGDLMAFDDDDQELTRCVVEEWIDNKDDSFYKNTTEILRQEISKRKETLENLSILKPYSFVLENDDDENIAELFVADDETVIIGGELMEGLDKELDDFFERLFKDEA